MKKLKRPNGYWTLEKIRTEALKYSSRQEFQQKSGAAYKAAGEKKCRDDVCSHMAQIKRPKGYWTPETLQAEALKYDNKVDFNKFCPTGFLTACRKNMLEQICSHMTARKLPNGHWLNKENCAKEALKYSNRREFSLANSSAYHGADSNGWLEEICAHMDFNPSSDGDAVYIWRAIGQEFKNLPVYKLGATSARLRDRRIIEVARMANMDYEIVVLSKVRVPAIELEGTLLNLGANPNYEGFNGSSEFRALSDSELQFAIKLIAEHEGI